MEYQFIKAPVSLMRMLDGTTFKLLLTLMNLPDQKDGTKLIKQSYLMEEMGMKSHNTIEPHMNILIWLKLITVRKSENGKGWATLNKCTINYSRIADADKLSINDCREQRKRIEDRLKQERKQNNHNRLSQKSDIVKSANSDTVLSQKSDTVHSQKSDIALSQKSDINIIDSNYNRLEKYSRNNLLENASQIDIYLFNENEINLLRNNLNTGSPTVQEICNAYLIKRGIDSTKVFDKYFNIARRKFIEAS